MGGWVRWKITTSIQASSAHTHPQELLHPPRLLLPLLLPQPPQLVQHAHVHAPAPLPLPLLLVLLLLLPLLRLGPLRRLLGVQVPLEALPLLVHLREPVVGHVEGVGGGDGGGCEMLGVGSMRRKMIAVHTYDKRGSPLLVAAVALRLPPLLLRQLLALGLPGRERLGGWVGGWMDGDENDESKGREAIIEA